MRYLVETALVKEAFGELLPRDYNWGNGVGAEGEKSNDDVVALDIKVYEKVGEDRVESLLYSGVFILDRAELYSEIIDKMRKKYQPTYEIDGTRIVHSSCFQEIIDFEKENDTGAVFKLDELFDFNSFMLQESETSVIDLPFD